MAMRKIRRDETMGRTCWVHVPSTLTRPAPLLMMLHGCLQTARGFAAATRMNEVADAEGFIVVYPQQSRRASPAGCWRWFNAKQATRGHGEAEQLVAVVDHVRSLESVDAHRVAVVGLSAGGAMAAALAVSYPDVFSCAAVHSGLPYGVANSLRGGLAAMRRAPVPRAVQGDHRLLVLHGEDDDWVDPTNAARFHHQFTPGAVPHETVQPIGGREATISVTNRGGSRVEVWRVRGLGHAWSGGRPGTSFSDPEGPDASRLVADFLRRSWSVS